MTKPPPSGSTGAKRPHVALLVETSLASGRDILRGIVQYVREHRPWALYHQAHGLAEPTHRWLRGWSGDGIIARIQTRAMAQAIVASGIPAVDVLGVVPSIPVPLVHVDDHAIARMAAEHLLERGFQNFGFFGIEGENWSEKRRSEFCRVIAEGGSRAAVHEVPRTVNGASWERVEIQLAQWVADLPKPVGIFVCSDQRGSQLLEACRRAGARVPDDVAVIGVDNDEPLCEVCDPPLSSIQGGHLQVGYRAAAVLEDLLRGAPAPAETVLVQPQQVITRLSTDVLAIDDPQVAAALRLIRDHAHEGLQVDAIAKQVGLSRPVLQRRFRSLLKRTVHQEIIAAKMKRARELLIKTNLPLAAVAARSGFKHQEYMGVVLRERLGQTPAQLRRAGRSKTIRGVA